MTTVEEIAGNIRNVFLAEENNHEKKLEESLKILYSLKESIEIDDFFTLFACFVNLYLMDGLHLTLPRDATKHKIKDTRSYFLAIRNDHQFFYYTENEAELTENRDYFLQQVKKIAGSEDEFETLKHLYLGIYHQERNYFEKLSGPPRSISDYYLFYMAIRDHIFAIEQRKNGKISKNEFAKSKQVLCNSYKRYKARNFSFPQPEDTVGTVVTIAARSSNLPHLPLPTIRYSDSLCQDMLLSHMGLMDLSTYEGARKEKKLEQLDEKLCEITKNQQLGNITEKGEKNQQALRSNIPEIRMEYLMFPLKMDFDRNTFSLLMQNYLDYQELEERQAQLTEKQKAKAALLKEHAHNWGHMNYPDILSGVAKELLGAGHVNQAETLFLVYDDFLLHKNDLKLLELKYNSDSPSFFLVKFKQDLCSAKAKLRHQTVATIEDLLEHSLRITLFRMLFSQQEEGGQDDSFKLHQTKKQKDLQESFSAQFLQKNQTSSTVLQWFNGNLYPLEVLELSKSWKSIGFVKDEMAYSFLLQVFLHLLCNALNYGLKTDQGAIHFRFYQEYMDGLPYLSFRVENLIHRESAFIASNGLGIKGIKDSIARLNETEDPDKFTKVEDNGDLFSVDMKIYGRNLLAAQKEET